MEEFFDPSEFGVDPFAGDAVSVVAMTARAAGIQKFEVAHFPALGRATVSDLADAAEQYLRDYDGTFEFLVSIKARRGGMTSDGMLKGVLNCMLAEARRREQAAERERFADIDREIAVAEMYERHMAQQAAAPTQPSAIEVGFEVPNGRYVVALGDEKVTVIVKQARNRDGVQWVALRSRGEDLLIGRIEGGQYRPNYRAHRGPGAMGHAAMVALIEGGPAAINAGLIAFGEAFGACGVCGRTLTDPESIARKIGPICAAKLGF